VAVHIFRMQQFCPTSSPFDPIIATSSQGLLSQAYPNLFKRGPSFTFQACRYQSTPHLVASVLVIGVVYINYLLDLPILSGGRMRKKKTP
jgi:hypothetical protein